MTKQPTLLTREALANGTIQQLARERDGSASDMLSDAELLESRRSIIADDPDEDIWVFAYGSLIWNPVVEVKEIRLGRIYGYHRRFCLQTRIGRGTPENPGLILGLDRGGCCTGQALRIDRSIAAGELDLLWKREMLNRSYVPRMLSFHGDDGARFNAVSFVMNHDSPSYVNDIPIEEKARIIATAKGFIGPCREYLDLTLESLQALGIRDRYLEDILARIEAK